jgi:two-component system, cell cycle response regulator CpdR
LVSINTAVTALSILVADDEEGIRSLLVHWLESRGHAVAVVGCARQAMHLMSQQCFDLVITDVVMPDGDGFELIAAFRKAQPATRIIAISGGGKYLEGTDCLRIARGLGAHAVVMKPFNWEQLQVGIELAFSGVKFDAP